MRNIKLTIAYDGSNYSGWQRQSNAVTIQGELEQRIQLISNHPISLYGAGRTDAGVHAKGMVANFQTTSSIACPALIKGLNSLLPNAIRIVDATEESLDFHARFSAKAKTYTYSLFTGPVQSPLECLYAVHFPDLRCPQNILSCLDKILGTHDFASFEATGSRDPSAPSARGSIRTLHEATFIQITPTAYRFQFTGDGFLRHMVRNLVGTLLEAGKEQRSILEFERTLLAKNRPSAGPTAPAHGLVLEKIFY